MRVLTLYSRVKIECVIVMKYEADLEQIMSLLTKQLAELKRET